MSALKGYADKAKTAEGHPDFATIQPVKTGNFGLDAVAHAFVYLVGTDAVEAGSTARVINATAHVAFPGDEILLTSGTQSSRSVRVLETTTNTITLAEALSATPAALDAFSIRRQRQALVDASGNVSVTIAVAPVAPPPSPAGRDYVTSIRNDYSSVNVTTGAWVQLIASTSAIINGFLLFDSSGQTLELGTGAAAAETRKLFIVPGGFGGGLVPLAIPAGTRVSIRAVSANATAGEISATFFS